MILKHLNCDIDQEVEESEDACKPEIAEILAKCKAGLIDYQANVNTIDFNKFATDMKNEQEFLNGLNKQLKPWMDGAEVTAKDALKKPGNFEEAREIESQCVKFAKEVRKANKLLGKIDEAKKLLARYQTTAEQQIEEQVGENCMINDTKPDRGLIRSSPKYGLSTPYSLLMETVLYCSTMFLSTYMGNLNLILPFDSGTTSKNDDVLTEHVGLLCVLPLTDHLTSVVGGGVAYRILVSALVPLLLVWF